MNHAPIEHPSDLTREQRQYLRNLSVFLDTPPTLGRIYQRTALVNLVLLLIGGISVAVFLAIDNVTGAYVVGGMFAGIFLRDFGMSLRAIRLWSATRAVIDRRMLDHLLNEHPLDPDAAKAGWE